MASYETDQAAYEDDNRDYDDRSRSPRRDRDRDDRDDSQARKRSASPNGRAGDSHAPPSYRRRDLDDEPNEGSNLFVTSLSGSVKDDELRDLFSQYGEVESASIMRDPHTRDSRGFGFVKMALTEQAEAAIEKLHGLDLQGRVISVEKARRNRPRTPTPGRYHGPPKREGDVGFNRRGGGRDRFDDRRGGGRRDDYRGGGYRGGDRGGDRYGDRYGGSDRDRGYGGGDRGDRRYRDREYGGGSGRGSTDRYASAPRDSAPRDDRYGGSSRGDDRYRGAYPPRDAPAADPYSGPPPPRAFDDRGDYR